MPQYYHISNQNREKRARGRKRNSIKFFFQELSLTIKCQTIEELIDFLFYFSSLLSFFQFVFCYKIDLHLFLYDKY